MRKLLKTGQTHDHFYELKGIRKTFVSLRHFQELFVGSKGHLVKLNRLTRQLGKLADAIDAGKKRSQDRYEDEIRDILKTLSKKRVQNSILSMPLVGKRMIVARVKESIQLVGAAVSKRDLSADEYHELKKSVRRLTTITRIRTSIHGEPLTEVNEFNSLLISRLGVVTIRSPGDRLGER